MNTYVKYDGLYMHLINFELDLVEISNWDFINNERTDISVLYLNVIKRRIQREWND